MIQSSRAGRIAAAVIFVLVVAAVATASMRWTQWRPSSACLLCGTGDIDVASTASESGSASLGRASAAVPLGAGKSTAGDIGPTPAARAAGPAAERQGGVIFRDAWQPWAAGSGGFRAYTGSGSGPSSSLGGLWRLMSLVRPGYASVNAVAASSSVARPQRAASTPRQPRSAPPAAGPRPPAAPPAPPAAAPAPTAGFAEHAAPLPDPFDQQPPSGQLDPGGPGGGGGGGGDLSATPEPGSLLLIGTGLLGIVGALRRRRLI